MRGGAILVTFVACACAYPEFKFAAPAGDTDSAVDDSSVADTAVAETLVEAPRGCAALGAHEFCQDFDSVATPELGWSDKSVTALGLIALDKPGYSGAHALLAETRADAMNVQLANVYREFTAPSADAMMRVEAWIKLEVAAVDTQGGYLIKVARQGDGVSLSLGKSGLYTEVGGTTYQEFAIARSVPVGVWFHAKLEVKLHVTAGSINIYIDDMTTPAFNKSGISTVQAESTARKLAVGLYSGRTTTAMRARFDDVTFDFVP